MIPRVSFAQQYIAPIRPQFAAAKTTSLRERINQLPLVEEYDGVHVVRDDLTPGGTKVRALIKRFEERGVREIVYPSCTWGGAQYALAVAAKATGKKATVLVPRRNELHPRTLQAIAVAGANPNEFQEGVNGQRVLDSKHLKVIQVPMGFLSVLNARARDYAENTGALYLPPGAKSEETENAVAETARKLEAQYGPFDEVWCAAGSGTLARGLQRGFQNSKTKFYAVEVAMPIEDVGRATVIRHEKKLAQPLKSSPAPFPSDPHYDRKAWEICQQYQNRGPKNKKVLFWNVLGDL